MTKHVEIRQAGRSIAVPEGVTILEAALADGIAYPHGCRSGRCGSCKSRLVSGEVDLLDHSRFPLSDEEKAQGLILACRAIPDNGCDRRLALAATRRPHPIRLPPIRWPLLRANTLGSRSRALPPATIRWQAGRASARIPHPPSAGWGRDPPHPRTAETRRSGFARRAIRLFLTARAACRADPVRVTGGSGLAPIKGIVEAAIARGMKQPIHVYFGARSDRDLYFVDHFEGLAQRHPNLTFTPVLSDAPLGAGWRTGFVTDAVAKDLQDFDGWKAYVAAGPPPMVEAAMQICTARGLRSQDLHADVFFTPGEASVRRQAPAFSGSI